MRILIISDTHGKEANLGSVLVREGSFDRAFHLGDVENSGWDLQERLKCPLDIVAGNCDYPGLFPGTRIVEIGACRFFLTHGHAYHVNWGLRELRTAALRQGCNLALYGHTHIPVVDTSDPELTVLNPGSLTYPRQQGKRPSYLIMTLTEAGKEPSFRLKYL